MSENCKFRFVETYNVIHHCRNLSKLVIFLQWCITLHLIRFEKLHLISVVRVLFTLPLSGVNLRTGKRGIFPSAYATDLSFLAVQDDGGTHSMRFYLQFLGSIQVNYNRGTEVLQQAINKVLKCIEGLIRQRNYRKSLPFANIARSCIALRSFFSSHVSVTLMSWNLLWSKNFHIRDLLIFTGRFS